MSIVILYKDDLLFLCNLRIARAKGFSALHPSAPSNGAVCSGFLSGKACHCATLRISGVCALASGEGVPTRAEVADVKVVGIVAADEVIIGVYFAQCHVHDLLFFTIIIIAQPGRFVKYFFKKSSATILFFRRGTTLQILNAHFLFNQIKRAGLSYSYNFLSS